MSVFTTSSLEFDTSGLMIRKDESDRRLWLNGFNDVLELRVFDKPPDIPVALRDAVGLRTFYDAAARSQGAEVLSLEVAALPDRVTAIRLMMRAPAKPKGFTFVGSVALPFKRGSFVLRHQATEVMPRDDLSPDTDAAHPAHALTRIRANLEQLIDTFRLEPTLLREPRFDVKPWFAFWQR